MKTVKIIVLVVVAIFVAWYFFEDYWFRQIIPENIDLSYRITITSSSGIREGCGTAIYRLSDQTAKSIQEMGLEYFSNSKQSRGYADTYHKYGEWQETPRKDWKRSENWSYELLCGGAIKKSLYKKIVDSGQIHGSYYSFTPEAVLMVIPSKNLVVFSYNG
jgi:hypothetical protein